MDEADGLQVLHTQGPHGMGVRTLVPRRAGEVIHHFTGEIGPYRIFECVRLIDLPRLSGISAGGDRVDQREIVARWMHRRA